GGVSVNNGALLTSVQASVRKMNGCQDTDNNNADFDVVTAPVPRNSSTVLPCGATSTPTITAGMVNDFGNVILLTSSPAQNFNISGNNLTVAPGVITISAPNTDFEVSNDNAIWSASTTIAFTSATLATTPVYVRFTPQTVGPKTG